MAEIKEKTHKPIVSYFSTTDGWDLFEIGAGIRHFKYKNYELHVEMISSTGALEYMFNLFNETKKCIYTKIYSFEEWNKDPDLTLQKTKEEIYKIIDWKPVSEEEQKILKLQQELLASILNPPKPEKYKFDHDTLNKIRTLYDAFNHNNTEKIKEMLPLVNLGLKETSASQSFGNIFLCIASFYGNLEIIKLLMQDKNVDVKKAEYQVPHVCNAGVYSAIDYALIAGQLETVKFLESYTPLQLWTILRAVCKYNPYYDITANSGGIRCHIATKEFLTTLKYAIDKIITIKEDKETKITPEFILNECLGEASLGNNYELVKILLTYPQTNPMKGRLKDIFVYPARYGHFDTVKLLIEDKRTNLSTEMLFNHNISEDAKMISIKNAMIEEINDTKPEEYEEFLKYLQNK
jgi:hypothetical protein